VANRRPHAPERHLQRTPLGVVALDATGDSSVRGMALVLMCGLSFSGKSTVAAGLAGALDAELLSLDRINEERDLHGGQGIPVEEWATTNRIAHDRAGGLLAAGRDVVVDDTGSPRFIRDEWRATASSAGAPFVLVWVQVGPELQRRRVLANRAEPVRPDVTDAVLEEHAASFEAPIDEDPLVIDAASTNEPATVAAAVEAIRAAAVPLLVSYPGRRCIAGAPGPDDSSKLQYWETDDARGSYRETRQPR
jgi:predicted kinase